MRGIRAITILLLLLLIIDLIFITNISADSSINKSLENTITVSKFGGDFSNIQEAINHAIEGSTIFIKIGIYNEILDINKKLTIVGENQFSTIINPISEENKYAIKLGVSNIILKNLSITNGAPGLYTTGIRINDDKSKIINCNLYDNPIGIAIFSNENIINNCIFWNCKDEGIALIGTQISKCDYNIISNCTFFNNCDGIELQFSSNNLIDNCSIYNNSHTGIDAIVASNNENTIKNCDIYNNKVNGIYISLSSNNEIIRCNFWDNNNGNILITDDSHDNKIINIEQKENLINNEIISIENNVENMKYNTKENNKKILNKNFNSLIEMILNIVPFFKTILVR